MRILTQTIFSSGNEKMDEEKKTSDRPKKIFVYFESRVISAFWQQTRQEIASENMDKTHANSHNKRQ